MYINLVLLPFVIILGLLLSTGNGNRHSKGVYIIICSVVLVLVAALRSPEWMTTKYSIDSLNYKYMFEDSFSMSWEDFWKSAYTRYFVGGEEFDIGFLAFNKFVSLFTHSFYLFSIISDLVFFIPFGIILYRYCTSMKQVIFAFVFYIALVQIFVLGGARQITAMGFDMLALLAVIDRKQWRAIAFVILGVSMHFSSLLFVVPLLMIWFNMRPQSLKMLHLICFAIFPLIFAFPNQVILFMGEASGLERYSNYGMGTVQGGASTFIFLVETLSLFCLVAIKRTNFQQNKYLQYFYVMAPFFTLLAPLIRSNGTMIRISLYYHLFLALLVPFAIDCLFKKDRSMAYVIAILGLALLTVSGSGIEYYFFWQK